MDIVHRGKLDKKPRLLEISKLASAYASESIDRQPTETHQPCTDARFFQSLKTKSSKNASWPGQGAGQGHA